MLTASLASSRLRLWLGVSESDVEKLSLYRYVQILKLFHLHELPAKHVKHHCSLSHNIVTLHLDDLNAVCGDVQE